MAHVIDVEAFLALGLPLRPAPFSSAPSALVRVNGVEVVERLSLVPWAERVGTKKPPSRVQSTGFSRRTRAGGGTADRILQPTYSVFKVEHPCPARLPNPEADRMNCLEPVSSSLHRENPLRRTTLNLAWLCRPSRSKPVEPLTSRRHDNHSTLAEPPPRPSPVERKPVVQTNHALEDKDAFH